MTQEFRSKNINEKINYFLEEIEQNELISRKHKGLYNYKLYWARSYFSFFNYLMCFNFYLYFFVWYCVSISAFTSLLGVPIGIKSSAIGLKICAIAAGIKKCKPIIKKHKKKQYKIALLAKSKLNNLEVLISKALIDWNISHDEFVMINNMLK